MKESTIVAAKTACTISKLQTVLSSCTPIIELDVNCNNAHYVIFQTKMIYLQAQLGL